MAEAIMTIEEHNNSSNSGTKKLKQKRVPQRGLGVAQLEKIRLEEQQIKDEILPSDSIVTSKDSTFRALKSSSILKNCDFRLNSSKPFIDNLSPKKGLESTKQVNVSEGYDDDCSTLCSGKFNSEKDHQDEELYHHGVVIQSPIFSFPQYQQPVCSSSMVNISSGISSSSVRNYQMEPPSNQSYHGYNYLPLWPDEVKRVGIKRPYPFPPEFPPVPTFHCKFPPRYDAPMSTANSDSRTYLKRFDISPEVSVVLVVEYSPLTSLVDQLVREVPLKSRNVVGQNRALNGDFLTLAPPTAVGAVNQQVFPNIAPQNIELFKFETLPFQEVSEEPSTRSSLNRSVQQRVFRFFPPPNVQIGQPGNTHGEVGGKVDLNLKL